MKNYEAIPSVYWGTTHAGTGGSGGVSRGGGGGFGPQSEKSADDPRSIRRADDLARALLSAGAAAEIVAGRLAAQARLTAVEAELRIVEYALGPLGKVRAAAGGEAPDPRDPQPSLIRLAARAFPGRVQRLGDRVFLDGRPVAVPELVRRARATGVRIRYPGLDPMEQALSGGPSVAGRRRPAASRPFLLTGGVR